ncbi:MAG: protein TonB [Saprospiraceae bacterium]|jgi:protein TonB
MQLELSGQEVFIGYGIIAMVLIILISVLRGFFKTNHVPNSLDNGFQLSERVKYASVDVFRHSRRLFGLALSLSLLVVICGFSWTTYDRTYVDLGPLFIEESVIDVAPPIIPPPAPKPPPPAPPLIEEVPLVDVDEEPADLPDAFIEEADPIEELKLPTPTEEATPTSGPPPPPPIEEDITPIFKVVEQMPLFGGCSDKACSDKALFQFLYKHLKYPSIARENGVEGKVYIQFVVEKDGSLTDTKIVRDTGAGLGAESMRVVQKINDLPQAFEPGRQRGEAVRVLFTLPVTFKLTQ